MDFLFNSFHWLFYFGTEYIGLYPTLVPVRNFQIHCHPQGFFFFWNGLFSGYLQSLFGICSIRIENAGVRRPASDDVQIHGIANPRAFRKVLHFFLSATSRTWAHTISHTHPMFLTSCATTGDLERYSKLWLVWV